MKLVVDFLENAKKNYGKRIAVVEESDKITYDELFLKAKIIASNIYQNIEINEPVIIFMDKGIKALEAFFGVLYAGGCYSLVNPEFPKARIEQIEDTLKSRVIITDKDNREKCDNTFEDMTVLDIDEILLGEVKEDKLKEIYDKKIDTDPVYINFTSGSTGVPKGVVVGNRSIIDFITVFTEEFNINSDDIIANQAPFDFDVSVKDIYSALYKGAQLVIVPKKFFSRPTELLDYLGDNKVTTMIWAVSALCLITTFHGLDYRVPNTVKKVIFSGEVMPLKHLKMWMEKLPEAEFINVYGPTEITCNCTFHVIDRKRNYEEYIPIGKPFKNERVMLLDENRKEIKTSGVTGEICVGGSCLALGYYNNKSETNNAFIQNPNNDKYHDLIYKTGDLGMYDKEGDLIFKGRKDFQIKYMGHRIELEEIDREIAKIEGIKRVVTIFYEKKQRLYTFYIGDIKKEDIIKELKLRVPVYMIHSNYIVIDEFKLNKNGKIDRKYLQELIEGDKGAI